jgi:AbrB family looped-hinge helix DNA binding protein
MWTMETATLSTKGQLVIPSRYRNALHLQPGDKVAFSLDGEKLVIAPMRAAQARLVKGRGGRKVLVAPDDAPPMTTDAVKAILADFP